MISYKILLQKNDYREEGRYWLINRFITSRQKLFNQWTGLLCRNHALLSYLMCSQRLQIINLIFYRAALFCILIVLVYFRYSQVRTPFTDEWPDNKTMQWYTTKKVGHTLYTAESRILLMEHKYPPTFFLSCFYAYFRLGQARLSQGQTCPAGLGKRFS